MPTEPAHKLTTAPEQARSPAANLSIVPTNEPERADHADRVDRRLERWKAQLIDLSRRNRLLNYKATKLTGVALDEHDASLTVRQLLAGERFRLVPAEPARRRPEFALELDLEPGRRDGSDRGLQTRHEEAVLEGKLIAAHRKAREGLQEHGVHTHFLAFGMVEWYGSDDSDIGSRAPLLLVPVELIRDRAANRFTLSWNGEPPVLNPAVALKLRGEFELELPELPEDGGADVEALLTEVRARLRGRNRWRVLDDVVLDHFDFRKFVMYRDLERYSVRAREHDIIRGICGTGTDTRASGLPDEVEQADLDEAMGPWSSVQVLDADSSQQKALLAVGAGHDLVIEGPPGTGKSQTITNLIAAALDQGKTVLFVSEKMAALEVVKQRLEDDAGLGDYLLELHSNKTRKTEVVKELSRVLGLPDEPEPDHAGDLVRLRILTGELHQYVVALHRPVEPLGSSPYRAMGELAAVEDAPKVDFSLSDVSAVSAAEFNHAVKRLAELAAALVDVGDPARHPLRGVGLASASRTDRGRIRSASEAAAEVMADLMEVVSQTADRFGLREAPTFGDVALHAEGLRVAARTPGADPSVLRNPAWNRISADARDLLDTGKRYATQRETVERAYLPTAHRTDLGEPLDLYARHLERGVWRWLHLSYWQVRKALRTHLRDDQRPETADELLRELRAGQACRKMRESIEARSELGRDLFGARWAGPDADWSNLETFAAWVTEFRGFAVREVFNADGTERIAAADVNSGEAVAAADRVEQAMDAVCEALSTLNEAGAMSPEAGTRADADAEVAAVLQRIAEIEGGLDRLRPFTLYVTARTGCSESIAHAYPDAAFAAGVPPEQLVPVFQRGFLERWIDAVFAEQPVLARFHGSRHLRRLEEFRALDERSLSMARDVARHSLARRRDAPHTPEVGEQLRTLQRESRKRRNVLPVRALVQRASHAVQRIKPCFLMSPLSVAQYLDPTAIQFDLVVFDEASQIPPADAIGAMLRGRQVIVVGDAKQLPPTAFFGAEAEEYPDAEDPEGMEPPAELESILDEAAVSGMPRTRLRWHYRSEHQSLIHFSNREFYADEPLHVFPSSVREDDDLGLKFHLVEDGVYEGRGRNRREAQRVAEAVLEHIRSAPKRSLGVATFGKAQQHLIEDELDRARRDDPSIEWFFNQQGEKEFFVKNLENIQGDDRDVIFLSVTYGRDAAGTVHHRFGPLNQRGGWRRLNVVTTRAKRLLRVFSSMRGDDIAADRASEGAALLRRYLKYAETGEYPADNRSHGPPDSPFEAAVIRTLEQRGYRTVPQVGDGGYRIDIGVIDDRQPGRYLCGVECDGATYHSAATVRDRDRLRQQVLERRGWEIHRIWSTDWFHDPRAEIERVAGLIEASRERVPATA